MPRNSNIAFIILDGVFIASHQKDDPVPKPHFKICVRTTWYQLILGHFCLGKVSELEICIFGVTPVRHWEKHG